MSKSSATTAALAARLLSVREGERIPTTAELAEAMGVGYGTVHAALRALREAGAVTLTTHGHQGTRLAACDLAQLWQLSDRDSLVGVLPLPQNLEFAGLATAMASVAERHGLPLQLAFRQGSRKRLELLREGRVDWLLASGLVALDEAEWCDAIELPPYTYYSKDSVVVITAAGQVPRTGGRVAIDRSSHDHTALTLAEFPDANLVDAPYLWMPERVVRGEVDATVWHCTSSSTLLVANGLSVHPLQRPSPADEDLLNRAALVLRREDSAVQRLLQDLFPPDELAGVQQEVLAHRLSPAF